ncbi:LysM peptidoglycan-binding domain-containing protein, partial [Sulfuritalea sp.]|uniref:LysM peptidoglycan-binding domain-containing protein n=1 Tax=Sulfuritalea sp. TaxID=2480090 RepID=UPI00286D9A60
MACSAQDILDFLLANDNRGNTLSTAQVAQLESDFRVRLAQVSVSVPGQAPDAITLLYNGDLSGDIKSYQLAEAIGRDSGGKVITLGQTESGKLLIDNAGTFRDHLINYLGGDTPEAGIAFDNLIKGTDASGTKVPGGSVFDVASAHMVEQAPGEFRAIAPFPREGVYTETEIARYLESSSSAKLEGIDKVVYQTIYDDARIRTGSDAAARFEVAKAASYMAWQNTMELVAAANPDGTLSTGAGGYATKVETGKFFVENPALAQSLPEGATRLSISDEMGKLMTDPQWSALAEGEATLRNALKSIESARPSLPPASVDIFNSAATKLGLVLGVASILVANHDAKAAEREGNYEKAAAIWRDWGVGMAGGIVVGELFAGAMIAMAGAPVTLGGSALFFVASAAIGVLGGEAALGLMHSASNGPTSGGGGSGGGSGADAAAIPEIVNINAGRDTLVISRGGGGESASLNASQDRPLMMSGTAPDGTKYQVTGNRNAYELELQSATGEYLGGSRTLVREDGARFVQIIGPDGNPTNEYLGYTVKQGDTLSGIASRYGVSLASVVDANSQIANPDLIYPGQTVEVPVPMGEGLPVDNTHLDLQTSLDPFGN